MKKIVSLISAILLISYFSCSPKQSEKEKEKMLIQNFSEDSIIQAIMYSNIDTINGHWKITISKEQAIKEGVSLEIYAIFERSINDVNQHIDSVKKKNPNADIGYNLFPQNK